MAQVPDNFSMNPEPNPLQQYLRTPEIYLQLPSGGQWWEQGSLEMPVSGELPILPMSTKDEIVLNTPDALMNGQGVVDVIHSCVPNIKNAWFMPAMDVDAVLIAIRIATYGEKMEYTAPCPKEGCGNQDTFEIDLRQFLDIKVDLNIFAQPLEYKGMQIYIRPITFQVINLQNLDQFEQARLVSVINDSALSEEDKQTRYYEIFKNMTRYTIGNVAGSISHVVTPTGQHVENPNHIAEFVENAESKLFKVMQAKLNEINDAIPSKRVTNTCSECSNEYEVPFTFDQANFFEFAS